MHRRRGAVHLCAPAGGRRRRHRQSRERPEPARDGERTRRRQRTRTLRRGRITQRQHARDANTRRHRASLDARPVSDQCLSRTRRRVECLRRDDQQHLRVHDERAAGGPAVVRRDWRCGGAGVCRLLGGQLRRRDRQRRPRGVVPALPERAGAQLPAATEWWLCGAAVAGCRQCGEVGARRHRRKRRAHVRVRARNAGARARHDRATGWLVLADVR